MTTFFSVTYGPEAEDVYYYGDKEAALHALKTLSQGRYASLRPILSEYTLASNKQYEEADIHWVWDQAKDKAVSIKFNE
jgi:hypothetical protein